MPTVNGWNSVVSAHQVGEHRLSDDNPPVDWIPGYLQANTRTNLRLEMAKQLSSADDDGYIYTFQIRGD